MKNPLKRGFFVAMNFAMDLRYNKDAGCCS